MLKKLKDHDKDPKAGCFDQQPGGGSSSSGNVPAEGDSREKEILVYHDST